MLSHAFVFLFMSALQKWLTGQNFERELKVRASKTTSSRFLLHLLLQFWKNITTVRNPVDTMASRGPTKSSPRGSYGSTWIKMRRNAFCLVTNTKFIKRISGKLRTPWQPPEYSKEPLEVHLYFAELRKMGEGINRTYAFLLWADERTCWERRREVCYNSTKRWSIQEF